MYGQCLVSAIWTNPSPWSISLGPGGFRVPLVWAVASVAGHCFGPGGLHVPPVVADGSEAGHFFQILFWFSRLTFVLTSFLSFSLSSFVSMLTLIAFDLLFNFFCKCCKCSWPLFWSRRLACSTCGGEQKRSWLLFSLTFFFFFFLVQAASVDAKLAVAFTDFWPRRLACATRLQCVVGHCY